MKDKEEMEIKGMVTTKVDMSDEIHLVTWNTGYGALDERQDCYWDGGKGAYGESKEVVEENIEAMKTKIKELNPDIFYLQELDLGNRMGILGCSTAEMKMSLGC